MATILHVISGLRFGGAETMLVQLAANLQKRGHPQHVVSLRGQGAHLAEMLRQGGTPVTELNLQSPLGGLPALIELRRIFSRLSPDVVQGWMYHGNLAATFAHLIAPRRKGRRLLWGLRAANLELGRYDRIIGWNARLSGIPDAVIANSKAGAEFHIALGFRARGMEVVANGIDTDKFRPDAAARAALRADYGISPDKVVVIHVARVDPIKDHANFLAAMKALPNLQAILVGAGTDGLSLPSNVRALGLRPDVERLYPVADIVASSSAGEGFSNAIAEGMSAGLIPVATDVGDAGVIVGQTGAVVPPGDSAALAAAIANLAALPPDARQRLGVEARHRIVEHFGIARATDRFEQIYLER